MTTGIEQGQGPTSNGAAALGGPIEQGVEGKGGAGATFAIEGADRGRGKAGEVIPLEIERAGEQAARLEIGNDARLDEALEEGPVEVYLGAGYSLTLERNDEGETQATLQTPDGERLAGSAVVTEGGALAVDLSLGVSEDLSLETSLEDNGADAGVQLESGDFEGSVTRESAGDVVVNGNFNADDGEAAAKVRFGDDDADAELSGSYTIDGDKAQLTLSAETDLEETLLAGGELDVELADGVEATLYADTDGTVKADVAGETEDVSFASGYDSATDTVNASIAVDLPDHVKVSAGVDGGAPEVSVEKGLDSEGNITLEGGYNDDRGAYAEVEGRADF
ncbi:MAG: hypothetical protein ACLFS2_02370 [Halochromatium sp.]|uniref:hypothetical protein n=1 Tax=Halochromatium sp. TaxID=2049430 RepID=UPI003978A819